MMSQTGQEQAEIAVQEILNSLNAGGSVLQTNPDGSLLATTADGQSVVVYYMELNDEEQQQTGEMVTDANENAVADSTENNEHSAEGVVASSVKTIKLGHGNITVQETVLDDDAACIQVITEQEDPPADYEEQRHVIRLGDISNLDKNDPDYNRQVQFRGDLDSLHKFINEGTLDKSEIVIYMDCNEQISVSDAMDTADQRPNDSNQSPFTDLWCKDDEHSGGVSVKRVGGTQTSNGASNVYRHSTKGYECEICHTTFDKVRGLRAHKKAPGPCKRMWPDGQKPLQCPHCDKTYSRVLRYHEHVSSHVDATKGPQQCTECVKVFKNKWEMLQHRKRKHGLDATEFHDYDDRRCEVCGRQFKFYKSFLKHKTNGCTKVRTQVFECEACGRRYLSDKYLKSHQAEGLCVDETEPMKCQHCELTFQSSAELDDHVKEHGISNLHKCEECGEETCSAWELRKHTFRHHQTCDPIAKKLACSTCGKTYKWKTALEKHVLGGQCKQLSGTFSCTECAQTFTREQALKVHMRYHTGVKPFSCEECGEKFISNFQLSLHRSRVHNIRLKHSCNVCDKSYRTSSELKVHIRVHTGEKPYKCRFCEHRFNVMSNLIKHERSHTGEKPYPCPLCEKRFTSSNSQREHIRVHTGEKPFSCDLCDKSFITSGHRTAHRRTHTGECRYKCQICSSAFVMRYLLRQHEEIHQRGDIPEGMTLCSVCDQWLERGEAFDVHFKHAHAVSAWYMCRVCNARFVMQENCFKHEKSHDDVESIQDSLPLKIECEPDLTPECKLCQLEFFNSTALGIHEAVCRRQATEVSQKKPKAQTSLDADTEITKITEIDFEVVNDGVEQEMAKLQEILKSPAAPSEPLANMICPRCDHNFKFYSAFYIHVKAANCRQKPRGKIKCDICERVFTYFACFHSHRRKGQCRKIPRDKNYVSPSDANTGANDSGRWISNTDTDYKLAVGSVDKKPRIKGRSGRGNHRHNPLCDVYGCGRRDMVCATCKREFRNLHSYYKHTQGVCGRRHVCSDVCHKYGCSEEERTCDSCGDVFKNRRAYQKHLETSSCQPTSSDALSTINKKTVLTSGAFSLKKRLRYRRWQNLRCTKCSKIFVTAAGLRSHQTVNVKCRPASYKGVSYQTFPCSGCARVFNKKWFLAQHMRLDHSFYYHGLACDVCRLGIEKPQDQMAHMILDHGKLPFRCRVCKRSAPSLRTLSKHVQNYHSKNAIRKQSLQMASSSSQPIGNASTQSRWSRTPKYKCPLCGQSFLSIGGLKVHEQKHKGANPVQALKRKGQECPHCEVKMTNPRRLEDHVVNCRLNAARNDPRTKFPCPECVCDLHSENARKAHVEQYHSENVAADTSSKRLDCHVCGRVYRSEAEFRMHARTHGAISSDDVVELMNLSDDEESSFPTEPLMPRRRGVRKRRPVPTKTVTENREVNAREREMLKYKDDHVLKSPKNKKLRKTEFQRISSSSKAMENVAKSKSSESAQPSGEQVHELNVEHVVNEQQVEYRCKLCRVSFRSLKSIALHVRIHRNTSRRGDIIERVEYHECLICGARRESSDELLEHYSSDHSGADGATVQIIGTLDAGSEQNRHLDSSSGSAEIQNITPHVRTKALNRSVAVKVKTLATPQLDVDANSKRQIGQVGTRSTAKYSPSASRSKTSESESTFVQCAKGAASEDDFDDDCSREQSWYSCASCSEMFASEQALLRHEFYTHSSTGEYLCKKCSQSFASADERSAHELRCDAVQILPYKCNVCKQCFAVASDLKEHAKSHIYEPFECSVCGETYKTTIELSEHCKIHTTNNRAATLKVGRQTRPLAMLGANSSTDVASSPRVRKRKVYEGFEMTGRDPSGKGAPATDKLESVVKGQRQVKRATQNIVNRQLAGDQSLQDVSLSKAEEGTHVIYLSEQMSTDVADNNGNAENAHHVIVVSVAPLEEAAACVSTNTQRSGRQAAVNEPMTTEAEME